MNGGTCFQDASMPNFRECTCADGYTGVDCETGENRMHQTLPVSHSVRLLFINHTKTESNLTGRNKINEFLYFLYLIINHHRQYIKSTYQQSPSTSASKILLADPGFWSKYQKMFSRLS